jgi:FCD domain
VGGRRFGSFSSCRFRRREFRRSIFWSPRAALVRLAGLLTILSDISRIVRVRGREDTAPTRVGRASALNHEPHRRVREISGQSTAAGLIERRNGQLVRHQFRLKRTIKRMNGQLVRHRFRLKRTIERMNGQLVRHRFRLSLRPGRPRASLGEHLTIIAAITRRQPDQAEYHQTTARPARARRAPLSSQRDEGPTRSPSARKHRADSGGLVIMKDDQVAGAVGAATSAVSPYETVP